MREKFIISSKKFREVVISFEFDQEGRLCAWSIKGPYTQEQYDWLLGKLPLRRESLKTYKSDSFDIEAIPLDLSFENFWNQYDKKVGKMEAERLYNKLPDEDKARAISYIPKLKRIKGAEGTQMPYPKTYLRQKTFLDE